MASDELVQKILTIVRTNLNPRQGLTNLKKTTNIVPGIMKIIKDNLGEAPTVVAHAPLEDVTSSILKLVKNSIKIPPKVATAVNTKMEKEGTQENKGFFKTILGFFSPKNKMATYGPGVQPNFIEPKIIGSNLQRRPIYNKSNWPPGYIFTTRGIKTGFFKNTGGAPPVPPNGPKPPVGPVPPVPPPANVPAAPRNYTKMALKNLLNARRKYPDNKEAIAKAIRKIFDDELRGVRYDGRTKRARRIGDLLRILPRNFNGRRNATALVIDDIRNTRNKTNLSNLKSNLGSVPNEDVRRAFDEQRRRLERRKGPYESNNEYRGRTRYGERESRRFSPRRSGESNYNYGRRREEYNRNEMRRRREAHSRTEIPYSSGNTGFRGNSGPRGNFGPRGNMGPPPIPSNEQRAINNAGGATRALNRIASVPGGAPEVAKAAEALNETNGNASKAVYIKGASPAAVEAVKNLGGPTNAVNVLSGLNTMAQKPETRARKSTRTRKSKVLRPRVAELNRVINAVKKQRLISLVAHNVTKTHNIHPNDEKLKKYYKKVIKANILRRPFAKIAKAAAKKRVA
jgi:hypothetical protein